MPHERSPTASTTVPRNKPCIWRLHKAAEPKDTQVSRLTRQNMSYAQKHDFLKSIAAVNMATNPCKSRALPFASSVGNPHRAAKTKIKLSLQSTTAGVDSAGGERNSRAAAAAAPAAVRQQGRCEGRRMRAHPAGRRPSAEGPGRRIWPAHPAVARLQLEIGVLDVPGQERRIHYGLQV